MTVFSQKIKDFCLVGDGTHSSIQRQDHGIPYYTSKNFKSDGLDLSKLDFISEADYEKHFLGKNALVQPCEKDIVFGIIGSIGTPYLVKKGDLFGISSSVAILRSKGNICPEYLYHYMCSKTFQSSIDSMKSGSAQGFLSLELIKNLPIIVPDLTIQKKIAAILSAYDDLIENNKKRIQILENMAEELYKEWFVRFRFPNWENTEFEKGVPEDWTYVNLLELADITYGYAFDSTKFNTESIGRKIIRIRNIPISRSSDYTDEVPHDKYLIQTGDLLVGMDGDFHMNRWFDEESYLVQRSCRIKSKLNIHSAYVRQAIKAPIHFFQSTILGATVGHLGAKHLNSIEILMPSSNHENLFSELNRLDKLILNLELQNRKLEVMRDNLLPRLISGKLSVESLDIQFPPSMQEQ